MNRFFAEADGERPLAQISADHVTQLILRAKAAGLLAHVFDQLRALNAVRKSGKIFDQRGQRKLAAGFVAFDDQRLKVGAGGVERRGVSGATGSDDDDVANVLHKRRAET